MKEVSTLDKHESNNNVNMERMVNLWLTASLSWTQVLAKWTQRLSRSYMECSTVLCIRFLGDEKDAFVYKIINLW